MIKVQETLQVSAEEFWKQILQSAVFDIESAIGRKVTENQLCKGYRYTKKLKSKTGQTDTVYVTITELDELHCYAVEFMGTNGINKISYVIDPLEDERISVTYKEDFSGKTSSSDWNYRLVGMFYKRNAKKKIRRKLHGIESYIKENPAAPEDPAQTGRLSL